MTTILCFGDSNTHGTCPMDHLWDSRRFDRHTRWPGVMADRLGDRFTVIEEGHPGRTTVLDDPIEGHHKNGAVALQISLESHRPVDLVLIMLGTNDLKARFGMTAMDISLGVEKLVEQSRASEAGPDGRAPAILLMCPPPIIEVGCIADMFAGGADRSAKLAANFAAVADRQQVPLLSAGDHIESSPIDGIHFDADAHRTLGAAVAEAVGSVLLDYSAAGGK